MAMKTHSLTLKSIFLPGKLAACAAGLLALVAVDARGLPPATPAPVPADHVVISSGTVTADDIRAPLSGSNVALAKNLPGVKWVWGAGWNWGEPFVPANWDGPPQNAVNLAEEKTALGVSIVSTGTYVKPAQIHISADLAVTGGAEGGGTNFGGGLGFWSAMPARDDDGNSLTHFTGLNLMLNGDLQLYEDGAEAGKPVPTFAITPGQFYNLAYDIDTTTGAISNVFLDGKPVAGLKSQAFKDAATAFAGVLTRQGAGVRMSMNNFVVSSISPLKKAMPGFTRPVGK